MLIVEQVRALADRVTVVPSPPVSEGEIDFRDTREKITRGKILTVGPLVKQREYLTPGAEVIYVKNAHAEVMLDGQEIHIVRELDVMSII